MLSRQTSGCDVTLVRTFRIQPRPSSTMVDLPAPPSFRLDGLRGLCAGAERGFGHAAAATLAQAGAQTTLGARTVSGLEAAAAAIRRAVGNVDILELDVLDVEAVRSAFSARSSYDILVNNAGTNRPIPFLNVEPDDFDAVCSLNVRAAFFVAQVVARGMVETGCGGSIIHMSSQMGPVGGARRKLGSASWRERVCK